MRHYRERRQTWTSCHFGTAARCFAPFWQSAARSTAAKLLRRVLTNNAQQRTISPLLTFRWFWLASLLLHTHQIFVHVENNAVDVERNMTFQRGISGNPHGNRHHTRHLLNQRFLQALLLDFEVHGRKAIEECRKQSPLGYVKVLGHLVPRETKIEHSQLLKSMSDQELDAAIEYVRGMLAARAGEIEGTAEPAALLAANGPSPEAALKATLEPTKRKPNRLMMDADTTVQDKPRKRPPGPRFSRCAGRR